MSMSTEDDCTKKAKNFAQRIYDHSQLPGSHVTPAAEEGNDFLSHFKGKYGEAIFERWLVAKGLTPTHTPFREDYTVKVEEDDFIVGGVQLDVKTKKRGSASPFPPPKHYNVNLGKGTVDEFLQVFLEVESKVPLDNSPRVLMVGWATKKSILEKGEKTWPGKISENGKFTFKRHDWDIKIHNLYKPCLLLRYLINS